MSCQRKYCIFFCDVLCYDLVVFDYFYFFDIDIYVKVEGIGVIFQYWEFMC